MGRLQFVWWGWDMGFGYGRWPDLRTRLEGESAYPGKWINFGFHAFRLGPVEFRYWIRKAD